MSTGAHSHGSSLNMTGRVEKILNPDTVQVASVRNKLVDISPGVNKQETVPDRDL